MSSLTLIAPIGYLKAQAILTAAQIAKVPVEFQPIVWEQVQTPEFLSKNPMGQVPILETPNGVITESSTILRHIARLAKAKGLYGEDDFKSALVDSQLDFNDLELQPTCFALTAPILGWVSFNQERYAMAKKDLHKLFTILEDQLVMRSYLVGNALTIADIAMYSTLFSVFKYVLDEEMRTQYRNVTRWFTHLSQFAQFKTQFGQNILCQQEWTVAGQSVVTGLEQQAEVEDTQSNKKQQQQQAVPKDQKPNKRDQKREQKKNEKEQKKQQQNEEVKKDTKKSVEKQQEVQEPVVKKEGNPLDHLPPSSFNLFDFKTLITNSKDRKESVEFMFKNFDAQGYSLYYVEYEKYEGEGEKLFLTSNFKDSFLQRLDNFRKYSYGVHGVYGAPGCYDVFGVWVWRGVGIPQEIKDLPNYEYHKWIKLDLAKEGDRKLVMDSWTGLTEDESVVNGKIARDVTCFK